MIDLRPTFPTPVDDPMPDLTERFRRSGAFQRDPSSGRLTDDAIAAIRGTLQSVVTGLQSDTQPFRAVFGKFSTAATDMTARIVKIGTKIMDDLTITDGQLAAAMVGLAYHEVAHINHDRDFDEVTLEVARSGHPLGSLAIDIGNIAMDVRIEYKQRRLMPGYADCLDVAMHFISGEVMLATAPPPVGLSKGAARTMCFVAVRTPWAFADWSTAPAAREWGDDFARRFERCDDPVGIKALLVEALDMTASWMAPEPTAPLPPVEEPPGPVCGPEGPGGEEPPEGPEGDDEEPPEGPGGDDPTDDEEPPLEGPEGPGGEGGDPTDDDEPPTEEPPKEKRGTNADDKPPTEDEPPVDRPTEGGDPTDGPTQPDGKPSDEPVDMDSSDDWGRENGDFTSPTVSPKAQDTEGVQTDRALEDIPVTPCSGEAAKGENDSLYEATAIRVGKSREASNVRTISSPGWPDRKVRRTRDWDGKRLS